jgi:hypothetical protein
MASRITFARYLAHRAPDLLGRYATFHRAPDTGSLWIVGPGSPATHVGYSAFSASDYVGDDILAASNRHAFLQGLRTHALRDLASEWEYRGDYGWQTLMIPLHEGAPAELWGALVSAVREAEDYPLLDESDYSDREWKNEEAAWKDYGAWDLVRHIREHMPEPAADASEADRLYWDLLDSALDDVRSDPYGEFGQRLWAAVREVGHCERETPGSAVLYPEPFTGRHMQNHGARWTLADVARILFATDDDTAALPTGIPA